MGALWAAVTSFNVLFLLNLWWLDRSDKALINIFTPDEHWESVPIFGLSLGSLFTIVSFALLTISAGRCRRERKPWHERIPMIWVRQRDLSTSDKRWWQGVVIVVCIIFPLLAHLQFWSRFDDWQAWRNYNPHRGEEVRLFEPVSPKYLLDWDAHRYGDHSRLEERRGVSFVPLFQPLIMMALTVAVFGLALAAFRNLFSTPGNTSKRKRQTRHLLVLLSLLPVILVSHFCHR
jgi:hypothetical protein